jgi:regulatory protein
MLRKITSLKTQKRNSHRINVFLDGEFAIGLSKATATQLQVGQEISESDITALLLNDKREIAYQQALKLISYRPRSEKEVRQNLNKHSIPTSIIEDTIDRLKTNGLIDDEKFALQWVENRIDFRPRSRHMLSFELKQKGITSEIIGQTLADIDEDELVYLTAVKQSRRFIHLDKSEFNRQLGRYLLRRGFTYEVIAPALVKIWDEYHSTES